MMHMRRAPLLHRTGLLFLCLTFMLALGCAGRDVKNEGAAVERRAVDLRQATQDLARALAPAIEQHGAHGPAGRATVAVLSFTRAGAGASEDLCELGTVLSDQLATDLLKAAGGHMSIIERVNLVRIGKDLDAFGGAPDDLDDLLRGISVTTYVTGTFAPMDAEVLVNVRAVSVGKEKGSSLAAESTSIQATDAIDRMMRRCYPRPTQGSGDSSPAPDQSDQPRLKMGAFYEGYDQRLYPIREGMTLRSGDSYCFYLEAVESSYVYLFQVDSTGQAYRLFPNARYNTGDNPLAAGRAVWVPNEMEYLFLDENRGQEKIVLVASAGPIEALARLDAGPAGEIEAPLRLMGPGGVVSRGVLSPVMTPGGKSFDALLRELGASGLVVARIEFWHQ